MDRPDERTREEVTHRLEERKQDVPWPMLLYLIFILGGIVYTALAPELTTPTRIFAVVGALIWGALWAIIIWILWTGGHQGAAWYLSIVPLVLYFVFLVVVVMLKK